MNVDHISGPVFSKPVALLVVYEILSRPVPLVKTLFSVHLNDVVPSFTEF